MDEDKKVECPSCGEPGRFALVPSGFIHDDPNSKCSGRFE